MNGLITISNKIMKRATIEKVGYRIKVVEDGVFRKFVSLEEAIEFCNKHKVKVTNKESLTSFFQNKLIH